MTEGKGYCARRQERESIKKLTQLVENKDEMLVIPEISNDKKLN